ncbi:hypothetical protein [Pseudonocardia oroxyli]|uniref:AraC-like ligand-binding domain-containing protein n=1 Tax=Pseudonocardia oroxyli TaxID=366584 RepID=UPI003CCC1824
MRTSDVDEASAAISRAYAPNTLQIAGRPSRFEMRRWTAGMPGVEFGYVELGTDVRLYAPPPRYHVVVLAGVGHVRVGQRGPRPGTCAAPCAGRSRGRPARSGRSTPHATSGPTAAACPRPTSPDDPASPPPAPPP